ncbi:hypothetical protein NIES2101_32020 [Calothrix sp. HK-06]|nr:hypothetical protein NIES2101_32020 [Calothrix sp. HK-06]
MKSTFLNAAFTCNIVVGSFLISSLTQAQTSIIHELKLASTQNTSQIVEDNDIKFQLQGCQRGFKIVNCSILITNLSDKNEILHAGNSYSRENSRVFDSSGKEYVSKQIQLDNRKDRMFARINIIKDVPIKAILSFEIPPNIQSASTIELSYWVNRRLKKHKVNFRNINFTSSSSSGE